MLNWKSTACFFGCLLFAIPCFAQEQKTQYAKPELLIEPLDLAKKMGECIVLDARSAEQYRQNHILGAGWVDEKAWQKAFDADRGVDAWSSRIGLAGIDGKKPIVIYDGEGGKSAARIWWILRYWGIKNVQLLNGGYHGWITTDVPPPQNSTRTKSVKLPTDVNSSMFRPTRFKAQPNQSAFADSKTVAKAVANAGSETQIIDARSHEEHIGVSKLNNPRPGCIPGSKELDWEKLVDLNDTQRFKSAEELSRLFRQAGIDLNKPAITHCQGGGRAAVMYFAMELMGAESVANYHASFGEWSKDSSLPVELKAGKSQ